VVTQVKGSKFEITLKEVKYMSELWVNLFSINKAINNGFKFRNDGSSIRLVNGPVSLCFDCIIPTTNRFVTGVKMSAIYPETTFNAIIKAAINNVFDINQLHKGFGHCGIETLRVTAKLHNLRMFGILEVCKNSISQRRSKRVSIKFSWEAEIFLERGFTLILVRLKKVV
jgi:hypothetical protein